MLINILIDKYIRFIILKKKKEILRKVNLFFEEKSTLSLQNDICLLVFLCTRFLIPKEYLPRYSKDKTSFFFSTVHTVFLGR